MVFFTNNCVLDQKDGFFESLLSIDSQNRTVSVFDGQLQGDDWTKNVIFSILATKKNEKENLEFLKKSQKFWENFDKNQNEKGLKEKYNQLLKKLLTLKKRNKNLSSKLYEIQKILSHMKKTKSINRNSIKRISVFLLKENKEKKPIFLEKTH